MHVSCTLKKTDHQVQIKAMCRFHPSPSSNQSRAGAITSHPPQTGSSVWKTTLLPLQTREHVCPHVIQLPFLHVEWTQPLNRWRQGPGLSMQCETDTHDMDITHMCIKHRRVFSGKHIRTVQQRVRTRSDLGQFQHGQFWLPKHCYHIFEWLWHVLKDQKCGVSLQTERRKSHLSATVL